MRAELEITADIIRVFDDAARFGEPFAEVLYLVGDEGIATLKGLRTERMTRGVWRAVDAVLAPLAWTGTSITVRLFYGALAAGSAPGAAGFTMRATGQTT